MDMADIERLISQTTGILMWAAPVILFLVFLILFIVNLVKYQKEKARPFKVRSIVFGCISGYFLLMIIGETALMLMLASAVAHM